MVFFKTSFAEPSGPPQNVAALTESSESILVSWKPPKLSDINGLISQYRVSYNASAGREVHLNRTGNITSLLVTQLRKYTSYYFTVKAVNVIGAGPASDPVFNTTFEDGKFVSSAALYQRLCFRLTGFPFT